MSYNYIKQNQTKNFIYPNNTLEEYDINIIHNIDNDAVSGSISGFTATASSGNINIQFSYVWNLNGAIPFINSQNQLSILSFQMMDTNVKYFQPFRVVGYVQDANVNLSTKTGTANFTITPAMLGVATITTGTYNFEVRMIGKLQVYPICGEFPIVVSTPTNTPTPTITQTPTPTNATPTPTPTITQTSATPTPTPAECTATEWKIDNSASGIDVFWGGLNCENASVGGTVGAYSIAYTGCVKDGTLTTTGFPTVTIDAIC